MTLRAPNETKDKGNLGQKGLQIIRKSTLAPRRIIVSNGSLDLKLLFRLKITGTILRSSNKAIQPCFFVPCGIFGAMLDSNSSL